MESSEITIRRVDPAVERDQILAVLERNLPTAAAPERIAWLYASNPDGTALVWLAEDASGRPVGSSAAHPRRMRVHGTVVRALNLGDFALDREYRSLGPGLRLLRATLEPVRRGDYAFSYDFPSRPMQAIYRRMGGVDLGGAEHWVRRLSWTRVSAWTVSATVKNIARLVGETAARTRERAGCERDLDVEPLAGEFGEEFDVLDGRLAALRPVVGVRDATYLNWRYLKHTMWRHEVLCARRHGALVGYAVLRARKGVVTLLDFYADADGGVRQRLAAETVQWARRRDARAVYVEVLAGSAAARMVDAVGFDRGEEGVGPIPFFPAGSPYAATLGIADNWWLIGGDRDI